MKHQFLWLPLLNNSTIFHYLYLIGDSAGRRALGNREDGPVVAGDGSARGYPEGSLAGVSIAHSGRDREFSQLRVRLQ